MSYKLNKLPLDLFDKPEKPRTLKGAYGTPPPSPIIPPVPRVNIRILGVSPDQMELRGMWAGLRGKRVRSREKRESNVSCPKRGNTQLLGSK